MTTTGAQYALAASTGSNGSGASAVGVDTKQNIVVVTTSSSNGSSTQSQSSRGQLITVVTSADPSSPNNLQPIQVGCQSFVQWEVLLRNLRSFVQDL